MIAALPMYERAETYGAHDRFWRAIRKNLGFGPRALTRDANLWDIWRDRKLLLAQTCGLPFRAKLHPQVTLVTTPDYGLSGCPPGFYKSVIVARSGTEFATLENAHLAFNDAMSQSGWAAPFAFFRARSLTFKSLLETGSHRASARAVAEGQADVAAIDAVSWRLITKYEHFSKRLRIVAETKPTPGLPLITARPEMAPKLRLALQNTLAQLALADREAIGINTFVEIPKARYLALTIPPDPARH